MIRLAAISVVRKGVPTGKFRLALMVLDSRSGKKMKRTAPLANMAAATTSMQMPHSSVK